MPFFQFSPPKPKPAPKKKKNVEYKAVVNLAPFSPNPKLFIEDVVVGSTITADIIIRNPSSQPVKVIVTKVPPVEREVLLNWTDNEVPACGECSLQLVWKPTVSGAWREVIHLKDQFGSRRDVPIVFKAIPPPKKLKRVVKSNGQTVSKPTVISKKSHINPKRRSSPFKTNIIKSSTAAKNSPRAEIFLPPSQLPVLPAPNVPSTPLRRLTYLVEKNSEEDKENTHRDTTGEIKILTPHKSFNTTVDIKDFSKMINFKFNFNSPDNENTSVFFSDQSSKKPLREMNCSVNYRKNNLKNNIVDNEETYHDSLEYIPDDVAANENVPIQSVNRTYDSHSKYLGNENVSNKIDNHKRNISTVLNSESFCFTPVGEARHVNKVNRTIDLTSDDSNLSISIRSSTVSPRRLNLQYLNVKSSPYSEFEPAPTRRSVEPKDSLNVKCSNLTPHRTNQLHLNIKTSPYTEFESAPMRQSVGVKDSFAVNVKSENLTPQSQFLNVKTPPYTEFYSTPIQRSPETFGNNVKSTNLTPHLLNQQYLNIKTSPYTENDFSPRSCSTEIKEPLSANSSRKSDSDVRKHLFSNSSPRFNNSYCLSSPNNLGGLSSDTYTKYSFEKEVSNNEQYQQRNDFSQRSLRAYEDSSFRKLQSPVDRKPENVSSIDRSHEFNISGKEARDVIEANLWAEPRKKSPARLECIQEENSEISSSNVLKTIKNNENNSLRTENMSPLLKSTMKRKAPPLLKETVFDISPPRKIAIFDKTMSRRTVVKETTPINTGWSKFGVKYDKTVVTAKIEQYQNDQLDVLKGIKFTPVVLENPDPFSKKLVIDPFLSRTIYYDAQWITKQEVMFRKWLNSLLAPPAELDCSNVCETIDVAELVSKNNELVSQNYHKNSRLNALRKSACKLFQSREMTTVLARTKTYVEKRQLNIRPDQNIHANIGLQQRITRILLCYNPLWLRIGLEAIYNERIPMESNADRKGLTKFIVSRLYQDPYLKAKDVNKAALKKFTLLKFLMLVYFLDQAKTKKLIKHDPCLFCINAPIKESREVLLAFSREMLSAIDIIRYLKGSGYVVNHKQKTLDEFDYAVTNLAIDLRDGVRVTRVMEIILMKKDLSKNLQVPASSRLRKVHNVKIAFDALDNSGFYLNGDIDPKDIVDGHREKTMSFLWQVVYNFPTPYFSKSAVVIQKWWRSPRIVAKRLALKREREAKLLAAKSRAVIIIQRHVRNFLITNRDRKSFLRKKDAAIRIQNWFRAIRETRKCIHEYKTIRSKVTFLQTRWRATLLMRAQRQEYLRKVSAIRKIQIRWRATLSMYQQRRDYLKIVSATQTIQTHWKATVSMRQQRQKHVKKIGAIQTIQTHWRARLLMRQQRKEYLKIESAIRTIQTHWRATLMMRDQRQGYLKKVNAIRTIQICWRATLLMRNQRQEYLKEINAIRTIQIRWRATLLMRNQKQEYLKKVNAIRTIQFYWRATLLMRQQRKEYLKIESAIRTIQTHWRATLLMRDQRQEYLKKISFIRAIQIRRRATLLMRQQRQQYLKKLTATQAIQIRWRATLLMRNQRQEYLNILNAILTIQIRWRATFLMRQQRQKYLKKLSSIRSIQTYWRATLMMRDQRQEYLKKLTAIKAIQIRWRASLLMRYQRQKYLKKVNAIQTIQIRWRATKLMRQQKQEYLKQINAIHTMQTRWRATLLMRQQKQKYLKQINAIQQIQNRWRVTLIMRQQRQEYLKKLTATQAIQIRWRATLSMRKQRKEYLKVESAIRTIQTHWRATLMMRDQRQGYLKKVNAIRTIQIRWRATLLMRNQRQEYLKKLDAIRTIQNRLRATMLMRQQKQEYLKQINAIHTMQTRWRATLLMRQQKQKYLKQINAIQQIQNRWRVTLIMRQQRQEYLKKLTATQAIQIRWRATLSMRKQRKEYLKVESAIRTIQTHWRATLMMRDQRQRYLKKVNAIRTIQIRWRATLLMRPQRQEYLKKLTATQVIQTHWRATLLMRQQRKEYLEKERAIRVIQIHWRATLLMHEHKQDYLKKTNAIQIIQNRWRATLLMREQKQDYLKKLNAIQTIQICWRAILLMRQQRQEYLIKVSAIQTIQIFWKATLLMRQQRQEYLKKLSATKVIQIRWRATMLMRQQKQDYLKKVSAIRTIQTRWRATLLMRQQKQQYLKKLNSIQTIQTRWRAVLLMRQQRQEYLKTISAAKVIQIRWRATMLMRQQKQDYLKKVSAIRTIQTRWRATLLMRQEKQQYLKKLNAIQTIQEYWRATMFMRLQRLQYLQKLKAIHTIQTVWKATLMMHKERQQYRKKIEAIKVIQKFIRKTIALRRNNNEFRKQRDAARIIQAAWRGYKVRKFESQQMALVRQRSQEATDNAQPENAVGQRLLAAVDMLSENGTMFDIIRALTAMDFLSRLLPTSFIRVCEHVSEQLYLLMSTLNRSVPHMEACVLSASTLINLATFPQTKHAVWKEEHIETILGLLMTWSDKEGKLFPYLCTLVWLICENREHAKKIKDFPRAIDRLKKVYVKAHRFHNMVNKKSQKPVQSSNQLPSTKFDWGIINTKRPRVFKNSFFGITSVLKKLDIAIPK